MGKGHVTKHSMKLGGEEVEVGGEVEVHGVKPAGYDSI